jgi:uronate dehydrogenase
MTLVLLTGAAGSIGSTLRESLPALGWDVRCFDRDPVPGDVDAVVGDLGNDDDLAAAVHGVDAIVHLAGVPTETAWESVRDANVDGLVRLFEAARRAGVRRVVYASSNHAAGFTPVSDGLAADTPPRPDTLYGVSKAFGEALGRYYVDRYGMQVACLRIGTFAREPSTPRALSTWLSPHDCTRLVDACLRSPALDFVIVWGVSANTRRTWDLAAGRALGYEPHDDAEAYADRFVDHPPAPSDRFVGGEFTTEAFGIDEIRSSS